MTDKSSALKHIEENYKLIPMSDITDEARELARRWYDGVTELNDIREKHKLASDIMNYAEFHAKEIIDKLLGAKISGLDDKLKVRAQNHNLRNHLWALVHAVGRLLDDKYPEGDAAVRNQLWTAMHRTGDEARE